MNDINITHHNIFTIFSPKLPPQMKERCQASTIFHQKMRTSILKLKKKDNKNNNSLSRSTVTNVFWMWEHWKIKL